MKKLLTQTLFVLFIFTNVRCDPSNAANTPQDFFFILDAQSPDIGQSQNVYIQINSKGNGHFDRYKTGGAIHYNSDGIISYSRSQVIESGTFKLSAKQLEQLWKVINDNSFFQLNDDYRMAMGNSYAFIVVEANGQRHKVDNIGMEVQEIRDILETTNLMLPSNAAIIYREGFIP